MDVKKAATAGALELNESEMALINRQSLRKLNSGEVFAFRIAACNDQVDREFERFSPHTLEQLAALYVGRTVLMDHNWSASMQTARVYAGQVERQGDVHILVLRAYMLRNAHTAAVIDAIGGGILREVSVGCAVQEARCSICGKDRLKGDCSHYPGREYNGKVCWMELREAADAYELSFVAVPAQREAGVIKRYGKPPDPGKEESPEPFGTSEGLEQEENEKWRSLAFHLWKLEELRYGGN